MYKIDSSKAEEFINHEEITDTIIGGNFCARKRNQAKILRKPYRYVRTIVSV